MSPLDYRGGPVPASAAATAAAAAEAGPSLFTRLGGVDAIRAVVHDFVGRIAADDRINALFRGVDIPQLERLLTEQICQATGGPCNYTGRSMRVTHQGMNITNEQFDALVQDLVASLNQFNVPVRERTELVTALGTMRGDIVGR